MKQGNCNLSKLVIVCGGTGGHFYPGLTIAKYLKENEKEAVLFLSGKYAYTQSDIANTSGIASVILPSSVPSGIKGRLIFSIDLIKNIFSAYRKLHDFSPDATLCMGSFASLATAIAAKMLRIPLFLHDGNARIGRANRFLSSYANFIALSFPPVNSEKIHCPYFYTGMPVREEIMEKAASDSDKDSDIQIFNKMYSIDFNSDVPTILIMGGSQGARIFNEHIPCLLSRLRKKDSLKFQVIHLTGKGNSKNVIEKYSEFNLIQKEVRRQVMTNQSNSEYFLTSSLFITESSDNMPLLYSIADLIICRSGGSTISELALFGKYALLSPFPYAAENHQYDNAMFYVSSGAGKIIEDKEWQSDRAYMTLHNCVKEYKEYVRIGKNARKLAKPDAVRQIIEMMEKSISGCPFLHSPDTQK